MDIEQLWDEFYQIIPGLPDDGDRIDEVVGRIIKFKDQQCKERIREVLGSFPKDQDCKHPTGGGLEIIDHNEWLSKVESWHKQQLTKLK